MRITSGKYGGRVLKVPAGARPSTDRLKESMFSALESRDLIAGVSALDLFAGSGALGLEAISRGAKSCHFVDSSKAAIESIRANIEALELKVGQTKVHHTTSLEFKDSSELGLVFIDPPYEHKALVKTLEFCLERLSLSKGAVLVVETEVGRELGKLVGMELIKDAKLGKSRYRIYQVPAPSLSAEDSD